LLLDALYAQTPLLELVRKIGWDAVISLKQNSRDFVSIGGTPVLRLGRRIPVSTEVRDHKTYQIQLWDTEGLPFTIDHPQPVRVVRSEEVLDRKRQRQGELRFLFHRSRMALGHYPAKQAFPTSLLRQLGHSRWKNENNGWMDLTKHWAFKHVSSTLAGTAPN